MRPMCNLISSGIAWAVLAAGGMAAEPEFALRDGDRVVLLGDSITEQKLYTSYLEAYTLTRFPKQKFTFFGRGWGGDTAWLRMRSFPDEKALHAAAGDAQQKLIEASVDEPLNRDVVAVKPTLVMINFGMNDHNYEPFRDDIFKTYVRSQTHLTKTLIQHGARVVLLTPQPLENRSGDPSADARNRSLDKFAAGLKEVAAKEGATFVNQFAPYMAILKREHALDVNASIGGGDEIHPGPAGHTLMASIILKQLNAPALVSSVDLEVTADQSAKLASAAKCVVTNVKFEQHQLSFERADDCLPMPVDARAMDALKLAPLLDDLNRYELKVTGLPADRYDVMIDGEFATTLTKQELAKGWNLAVTAGPISQQAREVLALIIKKGPVVQTLWEAQIHSRDNEIPGLQKQRDDLEAQITAACQTKPHHFVIKPST
ncbi:MAG: SGNH/GDSL hydrolase family protein [Verrucomicrobia bacterium]|nr:SGNH/GDSL hydrolase family protein [Verrucomicrobiota bacterium]